MTEEERRKVKLYCFERQILASQVFGDAFIEKVKNVFADVPYPTEEFFAGSLEHNQECYECHEVNDFFIGKKWEECLGDDYSRKLGGGQSLFKASVWHYFLPAYFIQLLKHNRFYVDYMFIDKTQDSPESVEYQNERIGLLTSKQCEVVIDYSEMTLKVWEKIDEYRESDAKKALSFLKENYQKALLREQNFNE
jgi:hypothetical protein